MSTCPGRTLEAYVSDAFMNITAEQERQLVAALAPWRIPIEMMLDCYEADEQSWRDYRNNMHDNLPPAAHAAIKAVLDPPNLPQTIPAKTPDAIVRLERDICTRARSLAFQLISFCESGGGYGKASDCRLLAEALRKYAEALDAEAARR